MTQQDCLELQFQNSYCTKQFQHLLDSLQSSWENWLINYNNCNVDRYNEVIMIFFLNKAFSIGSRYSARGSCRRIMSSALLLQLQQIVYFIGKSTVRKNDSTKCRSCIKYLAEEFKNTSKICFRFLPTTPWISYMYIEPTSLSS